MTSYSKGSPVSWNRGVRGGGEGKGRIPLGKRVLLSRRVPLGKRAPLGRRVAF
jgi:hypothetical protein